MLQVSFVFYGVLWSYNNPGDGCERDGYSRKSNNDFLFFLEC